LARWLLRHPDFHLAVATSRRYAGQKLSEAIPSLAGLEGSELCFEDLDPHAVADREVETAFLALPHGVATEYASALLARGIRVIDLSADFRLGCPDLYRRYYGVEHPAPDLLKEGLYAFPEHTSVDALKKVRLIACPGCYPTSILMPLLPLARAGLIPLKGIVINATSGISGAGKNAKEHLLFCERDESVQAYGAPSHRHLSEVEEQLSLALGEELVLQFTPHLVPLRKGIHSTMTIPGGASWINEARDAWENAYKAYPHIRVLSPGVFPNTQAVVDTPRVDMALVPDDRTGNLLIFSVIDNVLKGAGGQGIQLLNLILDLPLNRGLV